MFTGRTVQRKLNVHARIGVLTGLGIVHVTLASLDCFHVLQSKTSELSHHKSESQKLSAWSLRQQCTSRMRQIRVLLMLLLLMTTLQYASISTSKSKYKQTLRNIYYGSQRSRVPDHDPIYRPRHMPTLYFHLISSSHSE